MRSVLGYAVFFVGLLLAVQAFFPGTLTLDSGPHQPVASIAAVPPPETVARSAEAEPLSRLADFSPGTQLAPAAGQPTSSTETSRMDVLAFLEHQFAGLRSVVAPPPAPQDVALEPWRSAVIPTSTVAELPEGPQTPSITDGAKRVALIREIQRELKRVGCYDGNVDGSWGGASKRAMVAFIERVNASLPLNEPDNILLLLVKGQAAGTCGVSCPLGQTLSRDRRCVPDAILAYADKRPRDRSTAPATRVADAASTPTASSSVTTLWQRPATPSRDWSFDSRMSIGGPRPPAEASTVTPHAVTTPPGAQASAEVAYATAVHASNGASAGEAGQMPPGAVTDMAAPPAPKPRASWRNSRSAERRERRSGSSNYRSVQHLFEHPLGRM